MAPYLSEKLGQPIVIDNKSGANGNLATDHVSKARPDGHTLLLATSSAIVAAPHATPKMAAHPVRDLAPITMAVESEFILITNPGLEAKTFQDFAAYARKSPERIVHASPGLGSANHIAGELLSLRTGIKMITAHYRGSGPIMLDLLANQVNLTIASVGLAEPYIRSGRVGALMVMGKQRLPQFPNLPTSLELGIKDLDQISFWLSLHAPKATPKPVVNKIHEALLAAYRNEAFREKIAASGLRPVGSSPQAFAERIESDLKLYGEIFKGADIKIEQ
jgi:tripartite-type tricarboxylate transporter receptor subunit TctC